MKIILTVLFLSFISINPAQAANPNGLWLTENGRSAISIETCGDKTCGYIAWVTEGGMKYDFKNPKEALRGQAICGLQIMQGFEKGEEANKWVNGKIYKADEGDIYNANFKLMDDNNKMVVRGYVGIPLLGKSQTWKRVAAAQYPKCVKP